MNTTKETMKAFGVEYYHDETFARVYKETRNNKKK